MAIDRLSRRRAHAKTEKTEKTEKTARLAQTKQAGNVTAATTHTLSGPATDGWDQRSTTTTPPKRDPISGASVLDVRSAQKATTVAELLTNLLPPRSDQTVLELGTGPGAPEGDAAAYAHAGAQVTTFVDDAATEQARLALDAVHHVEQRADQPLASLGLTGRFDLVVARPHDVRGDSDLRAMVDALAPGGTLVFLTSSHKPPKKLLALAEERGLELAPRARAGSEVAWVFVRPGARRTDPSLDRITCVDRERVADLLAAPLTTGPASLLSVADDDATLRAQLDALVAFVHAGIRAGHIDVRALPFPDRVAHSAAQGAPALDALVVFAHPDDESGYAAGALAAHAAQGKSMHLVVATDGAGGVGWQLEDGVRLADVRAQELADALDVLGVGGHTVLGLPDAGMYLDAHRSAPVTAADTLSLWGLMPTVEKLVREIRERRPRAILGFDLERDPGYSLHGHHVAMGLATALAVHLAADPRAFAEQELAPWSVEQQWAVIPAGTEGGTQRSVDVDRDKKVGALKAHRSQFLSVARLVEAPAEIEHWHRVQGRVPDVSFIK